jgi:DNA-binding NtrC family response regulator
VNSRTSQQTFPTIPQISLLEPALRRTDSQPRTLKEARAALEKEMIATALVRHGGNVTRAAQELGVSRPGLYQLMDKLGIPRRSPERRTSTNSCTV